VLVCLLLVDAVLVAGVVEALLLLLAALMLSAFIGGTRFVDPFSKGTHAFRVLEAFLGRAGRNEDLNTLSVAAGVRGINGGILYICVKN